MTPRLSERASWFLERWRWRAARGLLSAAGWLLSFSHPQTIACQTSDRATASFLSGLGVKVSVRGASALSREDSHGLLLQLCWAEYVKERVYNHE